MCCSVLQCVAMYCNVLQCVAVCCSVLQCVAMCCSVLQCVAVSCIRCRPGCQILSITYEPRSSTRFASRRVAVRCSVAVRRSASQCVAVRCSALQCAVVRCSALQCVAVRCSALQCAAVRCSALQCVAMRVACKIYVYECRCVHELNIMHAFTVCCTMCKYTAIYCNTLQHAATHELFSMMYSFEIRIYRNERGAAGAL